MTISDNIAVREARELAFELASESLRESLGGNAPLLGRAWRELGDQIDQVTRTERQVNTPTAEVMSDQEAHRFERRPMKFGQYEGELVKNVPLSYLVWLDEDEFRSELKRYLRRREIWDEQGED